MSEANGKTTFDHAAMIRFAIGRELAGVDDQAKLLAVINALGMTGPQLSRRMDEYTKAQLGRMRAMPLRLDRFDEHWIVKAIAAYERRGGCREGASLNGAALAGICAEWLGLGWRQHADDVGNDPREP